ncbi:MAG TPA: hypothetical protein EYP56_00560 [Planctomycetaceae bacterium]|nr:hypothetical protein [Planctomycetaceae bacterium]
MAGDNPTLEELGIPGRAAGALKAAGLETRSQLEAFGLERIAEVKGIGSDYADEIRAKVAASYGKQSESGELADESPEVGEPAPKAAETAGQHPAEKERLERAALILAAGILANPSVGPLLGPQFRYEADLARTARLMAEAVMGEIDRDDRDQGAK